MMVCMGRLPGPKALGWAGSSTKQAPQFVQHDPGRRSADTDAEVGIERVDQGHSHAVTIDHREIDGIAAGGRRDRQHNSVTAVDPGGEIGRDFRAEQRGDRLAHAMRVGDVGIAHSIGQPRGFERNVKAVGAKQVSAARSKRARMLSSSRAVTP